MATIDTGAPVMLGGAGGGDGLFGGSGGGGLIGGLVLGSLLRNNGGGLLGGGGGDAAVGAVATQAGVQSVVNQSAIQTELADIKASIPFNEAQVQLALGVTKDALSNQLNQNAAASAVRDAQTQAHIDTALANVVNTINSGLTSITKDISQVALGVVQSQYETAKNITLDGDRTRSLITTQYEATLNRQLSEANAALIELRGNSNLAATQRNIEITTTNNINQAQSQQQQQQQFQALAGIVTNLANDLQYIRATNQAINIGSGSMTANPLNNNTNVRA